MASQNCSVKGCSNTGCLVRGMCRKHYYEARRSGELDVRRPASLIIENDVARVPLSNGMFALIDASDAPLVEGRFWVASPQAKKVYAHSRSKELSQPISMHRLLMGFPENLSIDHINGDTLDNRRCNLRTATISQNRMNAVANGGSSRFKGVSWRKRAQKWRVTIWKEYQEIFLGCFEDEEVAARTYDEAAKRLHGEFARLNFPEPNQIIAGA